MRHGSFLRVASDDVWNDLAAGGPPYGHETPDKEMLQPTNQRYLSVI